LNLCTKHTKKTTGRTSGEGLPEKGRHLPAIKIIFNTLIKM
jgi:hypothetical protein